MDEIRKASEEEAKKILKGSFYENYEETFEVVKTISTAIDGYKREVERLKNEVKAYDAVVIADGYEKELTALRSKLSERETDIVGLCLDNDALKDKLKLAEDCIDLLPAKVGEKIRKEVEDEINTEAGSSTRGRRGISTRYARGKESGIKQIEF